MNIIKFLITSNTREFGITFSVSANNDIINFRYYKNTLYNAQKINFQLFGDVNTWCAIPNYVEYSEEQLFQADIEQNGVLSLYIIKDLQKLLYNKEIDNNQTSIILEY